MKGRISWKCILCPNEDSQQLRVKITPQKYEPGSSFTAFWSHILSSKKRLNIFTLCGDCIQEKQCYFPDDQLAVISKVRDHIQSIKRIPWKRQQWEFWITTEECQEINEKIKESGELCLDLSITARIF